MRSALRSAYACNADSLTAAGHVVALEFATIAAANTVRIDAEDGQLKIEPIREPQPVG
jgi:hypothetical protein